jgi:hypothetical protein
MNALRVIRKQSVLKFSRTFIAETEESVVWQSVMDAYQSKPRCTFRYITHVTVRRRPVDRRLRRLAQGLERNRPKVLIN